MSRTIKGAKAPGSEWWSRRPMKYTPVPIRRQASVIKRLCHKMERMAQKQDLRRTPIEPDVYEAEIRADVARALE